MKECKRVALYARVSTDGQSVENQLQELETVARKEGWQIVQRYTDKGICGAGTSCRVASTLLPRLPTSVPSARPAGACFSQQGAGSLRDFPRPQDAFSDGGADRGRSGVGHGTRNESVPGPERSPQRLPPG